MNFTHSKLAARTRAVAMLLALVMTSCSESPKAPGRVLLIGIDGATPKLVYPFIEQDLLPSLGAIAQRGVSGEMQAHHPLLSPRIWTSIATGKAPAKHRIGGWVFKDESGRPRMYRSSDRKVHALWNIASSAGLRVGVVNWLNTYPPELVNGVMISDFAVPGERSAKEGLGELFAQSLAGQDLAGTDDDAATTFPESWQDRLQGIDAGTRVPELFSDGAASEANLRAGALNVLKASYASDRLVTTAALEVEAGTRPELLMVYLSSIDRTSHFLWGGFEKPEVYDEAVRFSPAEQRAALEAVRNVYRFTDGLIGELLDRYGENDLVMVVSDHGFEARVAGDHGLTGTHDSKRAENGVILARGPGIGERSKALNVTVNDVTPTILAWLGLEVGEDMDGRPASFARVEEIATIPTHDTSEIQYVAGSGDDDAAEDNYIEELRALGYVDDDALPDKGAARP